MKLNHLTKQISALGRRLTMVLLSLSAIAFFWQGAFLLNNAAMANPTNNFVVAADLGNKVQNKVGEDTKNAKGFIRDTADKVEEAARSNAAKVDNATDDNDSAIANRAKRDAGRIQQRAEEDASRTEKAVDNTKNVIEKAVDNVKDAFGK
ncbi:MAG: hypothetical protein KME11_20015 [Timaviella obliquedivisa GSE-PSE-MK23-08B]|jgi:cytoskeletal protein RodZ|nr:hypothetical protein [Timaviella obliquedivisa GSE-PSE-MK23-08B]